MAYGKMKKAGRGGHQYKHTKQGAPFPGGAGLGHEYVHAQIAGKRIKRRGR